MRSPGKIKRPQGQVDERRDFMERTRTGIVT